jgi:hypothetical protein
MQYFLFKSFRLCLMGWPFNFTCNVLCFAPFVRLYGYIYFFLHLDVIQCHKVKVIYVIHVNYQKQYYVSVFFP